MTKVERQQVFSHTAQTLSSNTRLILADVRTDALHRRNEMPQICHWQQNKNGQNIAYSTILFQWQMDFNVPNSEWFYCKPDWVAAEWILLLQAFSSHVVLVRRIYCTINAWLARCVHHWCVLRPADWHNIVCESSGVLGQHHGQHRPAQRPTGRGSTAMGAPGLVLAVFVLRELGKRSLNVASTGLK